MSVTAGTLQVSGRRTAAHWENPEAAHAITENPPALRFLISALVTAVMFERHDVRYRLALWMLEMLRVKWGKVHYETTFAGNYILLTFFFFFFKQGL